MNKYEAARELENEIIELSETSKKMRVLIQELQDEYFSKPYDLDNELDRMYIANDFERYGTYASMIGDYVYSLAKLSNRLDALTETPTLNIIPLNN